MFLCVCMYVYVRVYGMNLYLLFVVLPFCFFFMRGVQNPITDDALSIRSQISKIVENPFDDLGTSQVENPFDDLGTSPVENPFDESWYHGTAPGELHSNK